MLPYDTKSMGHGSSCGGGVNLFSSTWVKAQNGDFGVFLGTSWAHFVSQMIEKSFENEKVFRNGLRTIRTCIVCDMIII